MSEDNKWSQPESPPPPLFTGQKEKDFVKQVNDEVIERVVGQTIAYYPISLDHTKFHDLYGEAIDKNFLNKGSYVELMNKPPREVLKLIEVLNVTDADAVGGEPIFNFDDEPVGRVTSGAYCSGVNKSLALAFIKNKTQEKKDEPAVLGEVDLNRPK